MDQKETYFISPIA